MPASVSTMVRTGVVRHGQDARGDAQLRRQVRADAGQRLAGAQAARALDVGREVAVAQLEPGRPAEAPERAA